METQSIFFFIIVLSIFTATLMSYYGFKGRETVIGVDLGTTFSVVAINRKDKGVIIVPDVHGRKLTPSVVSYKYNGEIVVGYDAIPLLHEIPERTIYESKRFIGREFKEEGVQKDAASRNFKVIENGDGLVAFYLPPLNSSYKGEIISPVNVGTEIIKYMKHYTDVFLQHSAVKIANIAVPTKFNAKQREMTRKAFQDAGLTVLRILDEPSAAAIAYGLDFKEGVSQVLVYDFGGGTLDVSLLSVSRGSVQVIETTGDDHLGGSDFDVVFSKYLLKEFSKATSYSTEYELKNDNKKYSCVQDVRLLAEESKIRFAKDEKIEVSCFDEETQLYKKLIITRLQFENVVQELLDRALLPIHQMLVKAGVRADEIDEIVMVGGSSRLLKVRSLISEFFGGKVLNDKIDPDVAVAWGAALVY